MKAFQSNIMKRFMSSGEFEEFYKKYQRSTGKSIESEKINYQFLDRLLRRLEKTIGSYVESIINMKINSYIARSDIDKRAASIVMLKLKESGYISQTAEKETLFLNKKLDECGLSYRTLNVLKSCEYKEFKYVGDVLQCSEAELLRVKNFGRKSLNELQESLAICGYKLNDHNLKWDRPEK